MTKFFINPDREILRISFCCYEFSELFVKQTCYVERNGGYKISEQGSNLEFSDWDIKVLINKLAHKFCPSCGKKFEGFHVKDWEYPK